MPQGPTPVTLFGKGPSGGAQVALDKNGAQPLAVASVVNVVGANAGLQVKTGAGTFRGFTINTPGTGSTLVVYDGTSTSGTKLATFATVTQANFDSLCWAFTIGLFVVTTGTVADVTVAYN